MEGSENKIENAGLRKNVFCFFNKAFSTLFYSRFISTKHIYLKHLVSVKAGGMYLTHSAVFDQYAPNVSVTFIVLAESVPQRKHKVTDLELAECMNELQNFH